MAFSWKNQSARIVTGVFGPALSRVSKALGMNNGLTVFLFHEVTDHPSEFLKATGMWVSSSNFEKQIKWIMDNFEVVSISRLLDDQIIPKNAAVITFDDAWFGILEAVEKVLIPRKIPSCLFTNFGTLESRVDASALTRYFQDRKNFKPGLNWNYTELFEDLTSAEKDEFFRYQGQLFSVERLKSLVESPLFTVASHLYEHHDSMRLTNDAFVEQIRRNKHSFRRNLIPNEERVFAFPFGTPGVHFQDRHLKILEHEGVEKSFSGTCMRMSQVNQASVVLPRIHFSDMDSTVGTIWWACYKNQLLRR